MLGKEEFRQKLDDALKSHNALNHPLLIQLTNPVPQWDLLKTMSLQAYQLTKSFVQYVGALYYYCPIEKMKTRLATNIYEEETGRISKTKNHIKLMRDFLYALKLTDEEIDNVESFPETQELIDYRNDLVHNPDTYHRGAAAVMIASEGQSLEERAGEAREDLFPGIYGLTEKDLLFFSVHAKEDIAHVKEGLDLVTEVCTTAKMQEEAIEAVHHTCDLFYKFYDGVQRHFDEKNLAKAQ